MSGKARTRAAGAAAVAAALDAAGARGAAYVVSARAVATAGPELFRPREAAVSVSGSHAKRHTPQAPIAKACERCWATLAGAAALSLSSKARAVSGNGRRKRRRVAFQLTCGQCGAKNEVGVGSEPQAKREMHFQERDLLLTGKRRLRRDAKQRQPRKRTKAGALAAASTKALKVFEAARASHLEGGRDPPGMSLLEKLAKKQESAAKKQESAAKQPMAQGKKGKKGKKPGDGAGSGGGLSGFLQAMRGGR